MKSTLFVDVPNYYIKPQKIGKDFFVMRLYFNENGTLFIIIMALTEEDKLPSWENWSEENEKNLKIRHDRWLKENVGNPPYKYVWGEISSSYDPKSGSSSINIRFY